MPALDLQRLHHANSTGSGVSTGLRFSLSLVGLLLVRHLVFPMLSFTCGVGTTVPVSQIVLRQLHWGTLQEIHILRPHPEPTASEILGVAYFLQALWVITRQIQV